MKRKLTPENITSLNENQIFVFGSNEAGRHGKGAAKLAKDRFGATYGVGEGLMGDSYALPTKDKKIKTLSLRSIQKYVNSFIETARVNPHLEFLVTKVGCGYAGYTEKQIAPLFNKAKELDNIFLPEEFWNISELSFTITKNDFLSWYFEYGSDEENEELKVDLANKILVGLAKSNSGKISITIQELFDECNKDAIRAYYTKEHYMDTDSFDIELSEFKSNYTIKLLI
jgi:hypothetical protein